MVVISLAIVVAATPQVEAFSLLVLIVLPYRHHVPEFWDGLRVISAKVPVQRPFLDAVVEAIDDVSVVDVARPVG
jgi:hypothetical protein